MAFRFTVLLAGALFLAMYFAPDAPPETVAERQAQRQVAAPTVPDPAPALPTPEPTAEAAMPAPEPVPQPAEPLEASPGPAEASSEIDADVAAGAAAPGDPDTDARPVILPGIDLGNLSGSGTADSLALSDRVREREAAASGGAEDAQERPPSAAAGGRLSAPGPSVAAAGRPAEVVATSVNLRAGPSTANPVVGRVSFGDEVELLGEPVPGWAEIRHPDTGAAVFMARRFLQPLGN